jgi:flagellar basal-body rod modification protein FlgD
VGTTVYGRVTDVASDATETLIAMGKVVSKVEDILTVREKTTATAAAD